MWSIPLTNQLDNDRDDERESDEGRRRKRKRRWNEQLVLMLIVDQGSDNRREWAQLDRTTSVTVFPLIIDLL